MLVCEDLKAQGYITKGGLTCSRPGVLRRGNVQQQFDVIIHFYHSHVCMTEAGVCEEFLPMLFASGHISTAHWLMSDGRAHCHSLARSHCCHPNRMQQFGTRICRVLKVMVCKLPINV